EHAVFACGTGVDDFPHGDARGQAQVAPQPRRPRGHLGGVGVDEVDTSLPTKASQVLRKFRALPEILSLPVIGKPDDFGADAVGRQLVPKKALPSDHHVRIDTGSDGTQCLQQVQQAELRAADARVVLQVKDLQSSCPDPMAPRVKPASNSARARRTSWGLMAL